MSLQIERLEEFTLDDPAFPGKPKRDFSHLVCPLIAGMVIPLRVDKKVIIIKQIKKAGLAEGSPG